MPTSEVVIDVVLVGQLVADQFPQWASLELTPTPAIGWDNVMFRLGNDLAVRLPRRELAANLVRHEQRWLGRIAPLLPARIPVPKAHGRPGHGYPWHWSVCPWLPGEMAATASITDWDGIAGELGAFLAALHVPAPAKAPSSPWRAGPLPERNAGLRQMLAELAGVNHRALLTIWEDALAAPPWSSEPVWVHGDLHPANLLVHHGRLTGVVDWGDITSGDPACDVAVAWMLLPAPSRQVLRKTSSIDGTTWRRARGWAVLLGCAMTLNSADNQVIAAIGRNTLAAVLDEPSSATLRP